ncbi:MAG: hypothetical protein AAB505_02705, partial [Patescibacteria group bacterium]
KIHPKKFLAAPGAGGAGAASSLEKWRKQDQKYCEIEAKGSKNPSLGHAIVDPAKKALKDNINEQIGVNAIPTAVNESISGDMAKSINEELQIEINEGVRVGLVRELPKTLSGKLAEYNARGVTNEEINANRGLFKELVVGSIRESLPRVLNEDFVGNATSQALDRGVRRSLHNSLHINFGKVAKPTIETYYRAQIESMMARIPDMIREQVENIQATIQGTAAGLESLKTQAAECLTNPLCFGGRALAAGLTIRASGGDPEGFIRGVIGSLFPELNQAVLLLKNTAAQLEGITKFLEWLVEFSDHDNQEKFIADMIDGLSIELERSLTQPKNIERLADAITGAVSGPLNNSIDRNIDKVMDSLVGPIEALEDAIDGVDEIIINQIAGAVDLQLSTFIAQITGRGTLIIDHIGDTIAKAIDDTVGAALYPLASSITEGAIATGGFIADAINEAGYAMQDAIFGRPEVTPVPDDYVGALGPNQVYQSNFDYLEEHGYTIASDDIAVLRPSEISASDAAQLGSGESWTEYQTSLHPDGTVPPAMSMAEYQALAPPDAPLTGAMEGVSATAAQSTQESVEAVTDKAINNQIPAGELTSNVANGFVSGMKSASAAAIGSLFEGVPYVGPILAQVVEAAISTALGLGAPPGAGLPVTDVAVTFATKGILSTDKGIAKTTGKILKADEQIKDLTEKLLFLQIQACTNSKVMRRIQLIAEDKMFIWDPNARKAAAKAISEHGDQFFQNFLTGYEVSSASLVGEDVPGAAPGDNGQPLYVKNTSEHLAEVADERRRVFLNQLEELAKTGDYPLVQQVVDDFIQEQTENQSFAEQIKPTIEKETLAAFLKPNGFSEGGGWDTWFKFVTDPQNTPAGVAFLTREKLSSDLATAEQNAREELAWGQGLRAPRKCDPADRLANGDCAHWTIKTPAALIHDYASNSLAATLWQLINADSVGEDFIKGELKTLQEKLSDLSQYAEASKGSIFGEGKKDPCPLGPCPDSGLNL